MSRAGQRRLATIVATLAGVATALLAGVLVVDGARAALHFPTEAERVKTLIAQSRADAATTPTLHDEFDRQTALSLTRGQRNHRLSTALLASAGLLVAALKWRGAAGPAHPAPPHEVCARHAAGCAAVQPLAAGTTSGIRLPVLTGIDLAPVERIVARTGATAGATLPILHALQEEYRHLPSAALQRVTELTALTPAHLAGVASFFPQFRSTPIGRHVIAVCHGTACHVSGATRITDELRRYLQIAPNDDTDADQRFTLQQVPCLGCCTLAPVVQVDHHTRGHTQPDTLRSELEALTNGQAHVPVDAAADAHSVDGDRAEIRLGMGSCCLANGSDRVHDALQAALARYNAAAVVKRVGCVGMCHQTPFIEIVSAAGEPVRYSRVAPDHAPAIVRRHFTPRGLPARLRATASNLLRSRRNGELRAAVADRAVTLRDPHIAAFLEHQTHIATEHCGRLDPLDLDEYLAHDGFVALRRCLQEMAHPDEIIAQVEASGLRGRGGGGFPTGRKWRAVHTAPGATKYVICNGDEGDPGAFMDRMLLESYPYRILEGVAIAASAVGATEAIFYIRAEYPLAVERITLAIRRCEERGLLGDRLLGTARPLKVRVFPAAGAFVCGEETALIASIEGRRGMPTLRPPYPAQSGLWNQPTLVNNVETFAVVPWIIRHGPDAFAALGTATSQGTKVFALTGKIRRGGLIEVPMGVTIRQVVEEIGGGIKDEVTGAGVRAHHFKAVQIGGPSGGCIPAALADTPIDYEALQRVGAMMGSGGLVVLDETDCMVDIARYFLSFTQSQSCGKCVPCRIGTRRMLEMLERLCNGTAVRRDLEELEHLARRVHQGSLCGLGQTAPNPVLTTLRYFHAEYEAHVAGHCPAGRCPALIQYRVTAQCTGCTLCAQQCPVGAIDLRPYERHEIDTDKCTRCDVCRVRCPEGAIEVV